MKQQVAAAKSDLYASPSAMDVRVIGWYVRQQVELALREKIISRRQLPEYIEQLKKEVKGDPALLEALHEARRNGGHSTDAILKIAGITGSEPDPSDPTLGSSQTRNPVGARLLIALSLGTAAPFGAVYPQVNPHTAHVHALGGSRLPRENPDLPPKPLALEKQPVKRRRRDERQEPGLGRAV